MTRISVMVLFLVAGATFSVTFLPFQQFPPWYRDGSPVSAVSRYLILVIIVAIYLMLGCFLDAVSMMVLTMPVIFPVIVALNFDPIWFGVVLVLMMKAGLITPPVGLERVYTLQALCEDVPMKEIFKGATPFLIDYSL